MRQIFNIIKTKAFFRKIVLTFIRISLGYNVNDQLEKCHMAFVRKIRVFLEKCIVRVIHTVQIIIINICFTKTTHLGMENYKKFLKYFFSPQGPQNRVLNFEMMP
jgi:hypothetical protein